MHRTAVFFDRDGTLIEQVGDLHRTSQLSIFPDAAAATKAVYDLGYLVIIITNQPVVARGILSAEEVEIINRTLIEQLRAQGGHVDAVYFCPHHPHANVEAYRMSCDCRKPAPGMMLAAAHEYDIDLSKSFLMGDSTQDVQAGINAGVTTILVRTGHAGNDPWQYDGTPDHTVTSLSEAVTIINGARSV
jgi:D,D-heptose 1,7-bisphosphate phosphatase